MFLGLTRDKLIALLIVGLIGGLLSGFIGSGGAFVLTPAMMSLGAPGAVAVASNMCHKFPKAMVGAYKRFRYGQVDVKLGLVLAVSSIVGVQVGFQIQKWILDSWGSAGSDLYVSFVFVIILLVVGLIVFRDALTMSKGDEEAKTPKLALRLQKIQLPPMIHFKKADVVISAWVTFPVGFFTGLLAATIAVGGFVGVPGMVYVIGATAMVASATELLIAFVMGMWGSVQWAMAGLVDVRLVLIILATSLVGVQLGALGTTYVRDHTIKLVMGTVMIIVAVSRGVKIPVYLDHLGIISLDKSLAGTLDAISFWSLIAALLVAGGIISAAMIKGIVRSRIEEKEAAVAGRV
ncbi:MAG: sulfite exporter TauE/SafE family protein [Thermoleophilia bacterium]